MLVPNVLLVLIPVLYGLLDSVTSCVYHDYCVIGAGPGGLQVGYFMQQAGRNYVLFERNNRSGSFFDLYPRHRKLISINKRFTGKTNPEFNLRHDWNSLLSHDDSLLVTKYSKQMFPDADILVKYFNDFQRKLNINVQFNTEMRNIRNVVNDSAPDGHSFLMEDQRGQCYSCRTVVMASGVATPNIPPMDGIEMALGYESMDINPEAYEGKSVLILGRGNAAFEVADSIYGSTNLIHMVARSRVRLAWATHYVGDLRAINNGLLDTYQLKSLDGVLESSVHNVALKAKKGKIYVNGFDLPQDDNSGLREPYDVVIRALGFTFDASPFQNPNITRGKWRTRKYPAIHHNYESVDCMGLFYAGTTTHSLDFRKSAGGFIHGFRYTARALHRMLEWRYEGKPWPAATFPRNHLINTVVKRINDASGIYQMFHYLGDVAVMSEDGKMATYIEEFPIHLLSDLPDRTGIRGGSVYVLVMEYGKNFSGPGNDIFRSDRATGDPSEAHTSNFLHPVIYFYKTLPTAEMMNNREPHETLPRPDQLHHIVEDFLTQWDGQRTHILPFRRFLEKTMDTDLRNLFSQSCFHLSLTQKSVPEYCQNHYLEGQGLEGTDAQIHAAMVHGMM